MFRHLRFLLVEMTYPLKGSGKGEVGVLVCVDRKQANNKVWNSNKGSNIHNWSVIVESQFLKNNLEGITSLFTKPPHGMAGIFEAGGFVNSVVSLFLWDCWYSDLNIYGT